MTEGPDCPLQDHVGLVGQNDERPNGRNLESRNLEEVTKSREDALQVDQKEKRRQSGARKSVQFSDALVDNLA